MSIEIDERLVRSAVNARGPFQVSKLLEEALDRIIQSGTLDEPIRAVPRVGLDINAVADELEEAIAPDNLPLERSKKRSASYEPPKRSERSAPHDIAVSRAPQGGDMTLGQWDIENVERILGGHGDWFTARLLRLIARADGQNRARLASGFPQEVALVERFLGRTETSPSTGKAT